MVGPSIVDGQNCVIRLCTLHPDAPGAEALMRLRPNGCHIGPQWPFALLGEVVDRAKERQLPALDAVEGDGTALDVTVRIELVRLGDDGVGRRAAVAVDIRT